MEVQLKRFQRRPVLAFDLDTILVIFLAKNLGVFCPCPKNMPEAKLKNNRVIFGRRDFETLHGGSVVWLLVTALTEV